MKLFHGTNIDFDEIDLAQSNRFKDFGQGFYLTDIRRQATELARKFFHHDYDIVIGPIADDGVAYLLDRYREGSFTLQQLAEELKFKQLNNQYFLGTDRAISLLKRIQ